MKRIQLFLVLSLFAIIAAADPIGIVRAQALADKYKKSSGVSLVTAKVSQRRRAAKVSKDVQPLYIFNRGVNEGIVIISGDDCLPEVLGYTEGGDYNEAEMPPALKGYIEYYANMIDSIQANGGAPKAPMRARVYSQDIPAMVKTSWVQGAPYNNMCPYVTKEGASGYGSRALVGCVATATSQIAYYWGSQGYCNRMTGYNTPTYGYGDAPVIQSVPKGTPLKWELMGSTSTDENKEALATLNYVMGTSGWLTYGSSTGGYIWEMIGPMESHLGLKGGVRKDRSNFADDRWMIMCAEDLAAGHPILYSGYTTDWSGHAFVMDGYRYEGESNKFHFNYGWGSGWDGYFTIDDCRGYGVDQRMVYQIEPIIYDIATDFPETTLLRYNYNDCSVTVTNNCNRTVSGLYLFAYPGSVNSPKPSSLSDAVAVYDGQLKPGQSVDLTAQFRVVDSSVKFYVTDEHCRILSTSSAYTPTAAKAVLTLTSFALDQEIVETVTETIVDGTSSIEKPVYKITDLQAVIAAEILNSGTGATDCAPIVTVRMYEYDEANHKFKTLSIKQEQIVKFKVDSSTKFASTFDLKANTLYKASLLSSTAEPRATLKDPSLLNEIYFRTIGTPLSAEAEGMTSVITGTYGKIGMMELMSDSSIAEYDVRGVENLKADVIDIPSNPNALLYLDKSQNITGKNVIIDGVCKNLQLTHDFNFAPSKSFVAEHAEFVLDSVRTKYWGSIVLPFDAKVPDGVLVRTINTVSGRSVTGYDNGVDTIKAGIPYLYRSFQQKVISAENAVIRTDVYPTASNKVVPTFTNIVKNTSATYAILNGKSNRFNKIETGERVNPFTVYSKQDLLNLDITAIKDLDNVNVALLDSLKDFSQSLTDQISLAPEDKIQILSQGIATGSRALTQQQSISVLQTALNTLIASFHIFRGDHVRGDVTGSGDFGKGDIDAVLGIVTGKPAPGVDSRYADYNIDGKINVSDIADMINALLKQK